MTKPTVAILGASADRRKFGNKSVRAHAQAGYEVFPVNPKGGQIEGLPVYRSLAEVPAEHLVANQRLPAAASGPGGARGNRRQAERRSVVQSGQRERRDPGKARKAGHQGASPIAASSIWALSPAEFP